MNKLESLLKSKIEQNQVKMDIIPIPKGLQEKRAISYMNAILQALSNTEGFTKYFLEKYDKNNDYKKFSGPAASSVPAAGGNPASPP